MQKFIYRSHDTDTYYHVVIFIVDIWIDPPTTVANNGAPSEQTDAQCDRNQIKPSKQHYKYIDKDPPGSVLLHKV